MMRELEHYFNLVYRTIIHHQDPVTGLLPAHQIAGCEDHAWIRDNVYSIMSVWALSMAYRSKSDHKDDRARAYMLEKSRWSLSVVLSLLSLSTSVSAV